MLGDARRLGYVRDATIFGQELHLLIDRNTPPETIAADLTVPLAVVRDIVPSLEDVFVALTRAHRAG